MSTPTPPTDKSQLEAEIEQTRADLGQTVEALAAKTDVKARAQEKISTTKAEVKARAQEKLAGAQETISAAKAGAEEKLAAAKAGAGEKLAAAKGQTAQTTETVKQRVAVASSSPSANTARQRFSTLQQRVAQTSRRPAVRRAVPPAAVAVALIGATAVIINRRRSR